MQVQAKVAFLQRSGHIYDRVTSASQLLADGGPSHSWTASGPSHSWIARRSQLHIRLYYKLYPVITKFSIAVIRACIRARALEAPLVTRVKQVLDLVATVSCKKRVQLYQVSTYVHVLLMPPNNIVGKNS